MTELNIFQTNLASCIKSGDLTTFSALLAEVAPLDDQGHLSLPDDEKQVGGFIVDIVKPL